LALIEPGARINGLALNHELAASAEIFDSERLEQVARLLDQEAIRRRREAFDGQSPLIGTGIEKLVAEPRLQGRVPELRFVGRPAGYGAPAVGEVCVALGAILPIAEHLLVIDPTSALTDFRCADRLLTIDEGASVRRDVAVKNFLNHG
jgi:hypothetical protein